MNFQVINSGSDGNAVVIEGKYLIDCGVSFSKLKDYYKDLKIVFLTHVHGDHFKKSTIKRLAIERPTLKFVAGYWLVEELIKLDVDKRNITALDFNNLYGAENLNFSAFELYHDVPNCGYKIEINNKKLIYATDTNSLEHIEAKNYDYYLVEGNYETEELEEKIKNKTNNGEYVYENRVKETHLSKEAVNDWLVKNMGDNSEFIYMHEHKEKEKKEEI